MSGGGRTGTIYDKSPEDAAFRRWQAEEFEEVERLFAAEWRKSLDGIKLGEISRHLNASGIEFRTCPDLDHAYRLAIQIVSGGMKTWEQVVLTVSLLQVPQQYHRSISDRWQNLDRPALASFAPYAAFVVTIEVFFQIALAAGLMTIRNSNRTDMAYLFYLPFCQIFYLAIAFTRKWLLCFSAPIRSLYGDRI